MKTYVFKKEDFIMKSVEEIIKDSVDLDVEIREQNITYLIATMSHQAKEKLLRKSIEENFKWKTENAKLRKVVEAYEKR